MVSTRLRIRFTKEGDLRLISHRDLVRTMERLFRRAELPLAMSQGFHPKARMTFPSALALGIAGCDEVLEIRLTGEFTSDQVHARLAAHAPCGLQINCVEQLREGSPKARVEAATYQVSVPSDRLPPLQSALAQLQSQESHIIDRGKGKKKLDLMADLQEIRLADDALIFTLRVRQEGAVRASEVLDALDAVDLLARGFPLQRTEVHLAAKKAKAEAAP